MFRKTRPVPSRAALTRLYQLAYISSGTAVGLATLCAEERRRRTNYVQTIADNAKRIRQSPKHVSNTGRPARAREDGQTAEEMSTNMRAKRLMQDETHGFEGRCVRAPELSSFVDTAYSQLASSEPGRIKGVPERLGHSQSIRDGHGSDKAHRKRSEKDSESTAQAKNRKRATRHHDARSTSAPDHNSRGQDTELNMHDRNRPSASQKPPLRMQPMSAAHSSPKFRLKPKHKAVLDQAAQFVDQSAPVQNFAPLAGYHLSGGKSLLDSRSPGDSQPGATKALPVHSPVSSRTLGSISEPTANSTPSQEHANANDSLPLKSSTVATEQASGLYAGLEEDDHIASTAQGLDPPLELEPSTSSTIHGEQETESREVCTFLDHALRCGTLDEIRSLTFQALKTRNLSQAELGRVCNAWPYVAELGTAEDVADFYARVVSGMSRSEGLHCFLDVASRALSVIVRSTSKTTAEHALLSKLTGYVRSCSDVELGSAVEGLCWKYLSESKPRRAFHILEAALIAVKPDTGRTPTWLALQSTIAASLLKHDDVTFCVTVVASCVKTQWDSVPMGLVKDLLSVCQVRRSSRALLPIAQVLAHSPDSKKFIDRLSGPEKITLAAACCHGNEGWNFPNAQRTNLYNDLIGALPLVRRAATDSLITCDRMWEIWKTQRNWGNVRAFYNDSKSRQAKEYTDKAAFGEMELTLVQIMNEANRPEEALAVLAESFKRGSRDASTLTLIAVTLANKKAWQQVDSLMGMIKDSGRFRNTHATTRNVTNLVKLYSKEHSAAQTWKFVDGLIVELGFVPDRYTNTAILQSFVSNRALPLIPQWIRHLKMRGHDFNLDASIVVRLLRRYYREQRPPNSLLQWYCKDLAEQWPGGIDKKKFEGLIKTSAGYDLRTARGQNRNQIRECATQSLANLEFERGRINAAVKDVTRRVGQSQERNKPARGDISIDTFGTVTGHALPGNQNGRAAHQDIPAIVSGRSETWPVSGKNAIAHEMVLALSLQNYGAVMDLYYENLSPSGLPPSTFILEVAIEASARKAGGDMREASRILADASSAGMDIRPAMDTYTIQKIYGMSATERKDVARLQNTVLDYYHSNSESRLPVRHHVGTTAADVLINNRQANHAIKLLNTIYNSKWVPKGSLDIATLTVYLKAYTARCNRLGVRWVLRTVLQLDLPIDRLFLDTLRESEGKLSMSAYRERMPRLRTFAREVGHWRRLVSERRYEQRARVNRFGRKLVRTIISCRQQQLIPDLPSELRMDLERDLIGKWDQHHERQEPGENATQNYKPAGVEQQEEAACRFPERHAALRRARGRLGSSINLPGSVVAGRKTMPRLVQNQEWVKRYRLFLRRSLIMPDGKAAAFRLYVG